MKVLMVDDEKHILEYLKHLLNWQHYGVTQLVAVNSSSEAAKLLNMERFDVLITDIRMPGISGLDLLRQIKESKLSTKTIILSGYSDFKYAQEAIRLGVDDYVVKPVDGSEMSKAFMKVTAGIHRKMTDSASERVGEDCKNSSKTVCEGVSSRERNSGASEIVKYIKKYIQVHYAEDLSLDKLGELVHLHPVYLSRLFKDQAGERLSNYILKVRLNRGAELLADSSLRVNEICQMVGYQKTHYFIQVFKKQFGETPQQYRQRRRMEE